MELDVQGDRDVRAAGKCDILWDRQRELFQTWRGEVTSAHTDSHACFCALWNLREATV